MASISSPVSGADFFAAGRTPYGDGRPGCRAGNHGIGGCAGVIQMEAGQSLFLVDHIDDLFQFGNALREMNAELLGMFATFRGNGNRFEDDDSRTVSGDLTIEEQLPVADDPTWQTVSRFDGGKHEAIDQIQVSQAIGLKHDIH
jgi:hypothetical protein